MKWPNGSELTIPIFKKINGPISGDSVEKLAVDHFDLISGVPKYPTGRRSFNTGRSERSIFGYRTRATRKSTFSTQSGNSGR
jgi:hypothetical protein